MSKCKTAGLDRSPEGTLQKRLSENTSTILAMNTHYETLHLDFSHTVESIPRVRTYEGVDLCCYCLQFRRPTHFSKFRVGGAQCREPVPRNTIPCEHCGMPIKAQKNEVDKARHFQTHGPHKKSMCEIFRGFGVVDSSIHAHEAFKSLVCPGCKVPGFNLDELRSHIRTNPDGCADRKEFAKTMQAAFHFDAVQCKPCGFWLNKIILPTHVCGIALDPVWLGMDTEMPDLSRPYPVWGDELPKPHGPTGYGGGCLREEGQGRIPEEVLAETWHVPFATTTRYTQERLEAGDLIDLIHQINKFIADDELIKLHYADPAATNYSQEWSIELAKLPLPKKLRILQDEAQHLTKIKNLKLLSDHGITYGALGTGRCPGFGWLHSHIRCRQKAALDLGTVRLRVRLAEEQVRLDVPHCWRCNADAIAVQGWTRHSKYNATHQRICTHLSCLKPLKTAIDCEEHHAQRQTAAVELKRRALEKQSQVTHKGYKSSVLWRIVSRDDMSSFFLGLAKLEPRPWKWHQYWVHVAASMTSDEYAGPLVFHCDTESFHLPDQADPNAKEKLMPLEICILDRQGKELLNTTIDYGIPIAQLMKGCNRGFIAKACEIYGAQNAAQMTKGMAPDEIQAVFAKLGIRQEGCILVEHSPGNWDWKALSNLVGKDQMPRAQLTTFELLRLLSYAGPKDLQVLFLLAYPNSRINRLQHRALWDTCKMFVILKCVFLHRIVEEQEIADLLVACDQFEGKGGVGGISDGRDLLAEIEAELEDEVDKSKQDS